MDPALKSAVLGLVKLVIKSKLYNWYYLQDLKAVTELGHSISRFVTGPVCHWKGEFERIVFFNKLSKNIKFNRYLISLILWGISQY